MSNQLPDGFMDYLKTAVSIETDMATQEQIIARCHADMLERKPALAMEKMPAEPKLRKVDSGLGAVSLVGGLVLLGLAAAGFAMGIGMGIFTMIICGLPSLIFIFKGIVGIIDENTIKKDNMERTAKYNNKVKLVQENNEKKQREYDLAMGQWAESEKAMQAFTQTKLNETKAMIDRFYASEIIHPKYRTLPALTSIYEYFMTGRCTELTGPHGAYNLYEDELRKDTVISQLNTVIENLEQIRHNQYMLYQQVKGIQENTAVIASELQQIMGYTVQIAQLTALNAYYAALNERNTRITMYYHL